MDMQSKAKKLIEMIQTAPVEWKPLGEVAKVLRGKRLTKKELIEGGKYPVFHGGLIPLGWFDQFNRRANQTMIINTGSIGEVIWSGVDFWSSDGTFVIQTPNYLDDKFIFYFLKTREGYLKSQKRVGGVPTIDRLVVENISIPIPPLETQQKIVKILDKFTKLEATLEATLEAELALRKRQYQYYRDFLLDFDNQIEEGGIADGYKSRLKDVAWKTLGEVCKKIYSGGTPKTGQSEYWENGTIPWMSSGEVNLGTIYATEKFISDAGLKNSSAKFVPENSIVMALAGQGKTRGKVARTRISLTTNQSLAALVFNTNMVNPDYAYHFLNTQYEKLREISSGEGVRGGLNLQMISNYKIPIPPLPKQEKIAAILDKFDTLTHSISEGLPHEIALRRKQYEYYREQLLAFPKAA